MVEKSNVPRRGPTAPWGDFFCLTEVIQFFECCGALLCGRRGTQTGASESKTTPGGLERPQSKLGPVEIEGQRGAEGRGWSEGRGADRGRIGARGGAPIALQQGATIY